MMTLHAPAVLPAHERLRVAGAVARATSAPGTPALAEAFLRAWEAYVVLDHTRAVRAWAADGGRADRYPAPSAAEERICAEVDLARGDLLAALRMSLLPDGLLPIEVLRDGGGHVIEISLRGDPLRPAWVVGVAEIAAGGVVGQAAADEGGEA